MGCLRVRVESKSGKNIICTVINGGLLKEHKGVNLPGRRRQRAER